MSCGIDGRVAWELAKWRAKRTPARREAVELRARRIGAAPGSEPIRSGRVEQEKTSDGGAATASRAQVRQAQQRQEDQGHGRDRYESLHNVSYRTLHPGCGSVLRVRSGVTFRTDVPGHPRAERRAPGPGARAAGAAASASAGTRGGDVGGYLRLAGAARS